MAVKYRHFCCKYYKYKICWSYTRYVEAMNADHKHCKTIVNPLEWHSKAPLANKVDFLRMWDMSSYHPYWKMQSKSKERLDYVRKLYRLRIYVFEK
jgi:hypothetical protein